VPKVDLTTQLKNVSEKDRKQIEQAQEMLGPDPETMGFIKSLFWGRFRQPLVFPFPQIAAEETARCDQLLAELDSYLRTEHPSIEIDRTQQIPQWCIDRLFKMGVMGMIVDKEYGGGGYSITSYNRVLDRIGQTCGSMAVTVSAHQSIGCGAVMLFGTDEQKATWLPRISREMLSAFCLSEPNVGCDAAGQETTVTVSEDGEYYILNGEKKWASSGALAGLFTVMAKHKMTHPKTGKEIVAMTAVLVTPDMEGIDVFSRNRSKCGIRGTWQARIRFTNVQVPRVNLLHREGKGINVALTCLNIGRCTLSAGMVGAGRQARDQASKWAKYRHQFDRPIGAFEQVKEKLAAIHAYCYAMEAMLYMTTGIVDRGDEDIMLETAICKIFCSEMGFRCTDHAMQIMGGEGYMTENELERLWRDSRINMIVEGANEVMHSFVFAYGSKQLGEYMLGVRAAPFKNLGAAMKIAGQLFLGLRPAAPSITGLDPSLAKYTSQLESLIREFSHQVKMMFKEHGEKLITAQMIQARLSCSVIWIHALTCSLSRLDHSIRNSVDGTQLAYERSMVDHISDLAGKAIKDAIRDLRKNTDVSMLAAADAAETFSVALPNADYYIPERTPDLDVRGTGKSADQACIDQFGSGSMASEFAEHGL